MWLCSVVSSGILFYFKVSVLNQCDYSSFSSSFRQDRLEFFPGQVVYLSSANSENWYDNIFSVFIRSLGG